MQEMMKMQHGRYGHVGMGGETTLILNANHPLVQYVAEHKDSEKYGYDL